MGLFDDWFGDPYEDARRFRQEDYDRQQADFARRRMAGQDVINRYLRPLNARYLPEAQRHMEQLPGIVERGFRSARGAVSQSFSSSRTETADRGQKALAGVRQGLTDAGFSSAAGIMQNAQIGIGQQTSRALAALESQMAQMMADLDVREVSAMSAAQSRLGSFVMDRLRAEQLPALLEYELLTGVGPGPAFSANNPDFGGLGVLGDQFSDLFSGE